MLTLADNISIKFDDRELKKALSNIRSLTKGDKTLMELIAIIANKNVFDHFDRHKSGSKTRWSDLASSTQKQRVKKKKSPNDMLRFTRHLQNSIKPESKPLQAILKTNVEYAAIHNFGGQAGLGKKVTIPQREFMWLDEKTKQNILKAISDRIKTKWKSG